MSVFCSLLALSGQSSVPVKYQIMTFPSDKCMCLQIMPFFILLSEFIHQKSEPEGLLLLHDDAAGATVVLLLLLGWMK
jgi:membrane-bound acyltransferase YfiQ involved in biofilm formation